MKIGYVNTLKREDQKDIYLFPTIAIGKYGENFDYSGLYIYFGWLNCLFYIGFQNGDK